MVPAEFPTFLTAALVFLIAPFLPTPLIMLLDHLFVRVLSVILLLAMIHKGTTVGIAGLLALSALFMERNRRKVAYAQDKWNTMENPMISRPATIKESTVPPSTLQPAAFDVPEDEEAPFAPSDDPIDISVFEPVDETINQKVVLSSAYPLGARSASSTASSESLYEQLGFGHVRGVETVS